MVSHLNFGAAILKRLLPLLCLGFMQVSHAQETTSGGYMGFAIGSFDYEETFEGLTLADTTSSVPHSRRLSLQRQLRARRRMGRDVRPGR